MLRVLVGVVAALAAAVVLWSTAPWGSGLDNDSVDYLAAAHSLRLGEGWLGSNGKPFTLWPPLWPALLAAGNALGLSFDASTRTWNALATFVVVAGSGELAFRLTRSRVASLFAAVAMALSPALHASAVMGLSEAVFVALVVGASLALHAHLQAPTPRTLAACAALAALAPLQRYVGAAVVASIAAAMLFAGPGANWRARAIRAVSFASAASLPLAGWCARNYSLTGTWTGARGIREGLPWEQVARQSGTTLVRWFSPYGSSTALAQFSIAALLVAFVAIAAAAARRREDRWTLFAFPAVYLLMNSWFNHRMVLDGIGDRQMLPLAPPLVWMCATAAVLSVRRMERPTARRALAATLTILVLAHFATSFGELARRCREWRAEGAGVYGTRALSESKIVQELLSMELHGEIASNDPHAVYLFTGRYATPLPLRQNGFRKLKEPAGLRARTVVWFRMNDRAKFPEEMLADAYEIHVVARHPKGGVYSLVPRRAE